MLSSLIQRSNHWCSGIASTLKSSCSAAAPTIQNSLLYIGGALVGTVVGGTRLYTSLGDYRYRMDGAMMHVGHFNVSSDAYKQNPVTNTIAATGMVLSASMSMLIGIPLTFIYLKNKISKRIAATTSAPDTTEEKKPLLEAKTTIQRSMTTKNILLLNMARLSLLFMSLANFNGGVRMAERSDITELYKKLLVASLAVGTQFLYIYITTKDDVDNSVTSDKKIIDPARLEKIDALIIIDTAMTAFIAMHSTIGGLETIARLADTDLPALIKGMAIVLSGSTALTRRYCTNGAALKKNYKNEYRTPQPCSVVNVGYYPLTTATGIPDALLTGFSATGTVLFDIDKVFSINCTLSDILFGGWCQGAFTTLTVIGGATYGYATYNYNTVRQRESLALQVCGEQAFQSAAVIEDIEKIETAKAQQPVWQAMPGYGSTGDTIIAVHSPSRFKGSLHPNLPRREPEKGIELQISPMKKL